MYTLRYMPLVLIAGWIQSGSPAKQYLDKKLYLLMEKGETHSAAQLLLDTCENDISCMPLSMKGYDHYEIWDFVKYPAPLFARPKLNMISGIDNLSPSTVIHMRKPCSARNISAANYYRTDNRSGMVSFHYQMSPRTWLTCCIVYRTDQASTCTKTVGANLDTSFSGGEHMLVKKNKGDFQINFRFGCKAKECLLILRQIKLHDIVESSSIAQPPEQVLSNKSIEFVEEAVQIRTFSLGRSVGRDLSHLVANAVQQEEDEAAARRAGPRVNDVNRRYPPPRAPKREKPATTPKPTKKPTTTKKPVKTTKKRATCAPETTTMETTTVETELSTVDSSEDDYDPNGDTDMDLEDLLKAASQVAAVAAAGTVFVKFLLFMLGAKAYDEVTKIVANLIKGNGTDSSVHLQKTYDNSIKLMENYRTSEYSRSVDFVALFLALSANVLHNVPTLAPTAESLDSPWFDVAFIIKQNDDAAGKYDDIAIDNEIFYETSPAEEEGQTNQPIGPELPIIVEQNNYDFGKMLTLLKRDLVTRIVENPPDLSNHFTGWQLDVMEWDKPILHIGAVKDWYEVKSNAASEILKFDLTNSMSFESDRTLYATNLPHFRDTRHTDIESDYFKCTIESGQNFTVEYRLATEKPITLINVCIVSAYERKRCKNQRNWKQCRFETCVADFTSFTTLLKVTHFQIVFEIWPDVSFGYEISQNLIIVDIQSSVTSYSRNKLCQKYSETQPEQPRVSSNDCDSPKIPMEKVATADFPVAYSERRGGYSSFLEFNLIGRWFKTACTLDFGNNLAALMPPSVQLVARHTTAFSLNLTPGEKSYASGIKMACMSNTTSVTLYMSATSGVILYVCSYAEELLGSFECSTALHVSVAGYPNFKLVFKSPARMLDFYAKADDAAPFNSTLTILMGNIDAQC